MPKLRRKSPKSRPTLEKVLTLCSKSEIVLKSARRVKKSAVKSKKCSKSGLRDWDKPMHKPSFYFIDFLQSSGFRRLCWDNLYFFYEYGELTNILIDWRGFYHLISWQHKKADACFPRLILQVSFFFFSQRTYSLVMIKIIVLTGSLIIFICRRQKNVKRRKILRRPSVLNQVTELSTRKNICRVNTFFPFICWTILFFYNNKAPSTRRRL